MIIIIWSMIGILLINLLMTFLKSQKVCKIILILIFIVVYLDIKIFFVISVIFFISNLIIMDITYYLQMQHALASQDQVKNTYILLIQCVNLFITMRIICMKLLIHSKKLTRNITRMTWITCIAKNYLDKI